MVSKRVEIEVTAVYPHMVYMFLKECLPTFSIEEIAGSATHLKLVGPSRIGDMADCQLNVDAPLIQSFVDCMIKGAYCVA